MDRIKSQNCGGRAWSKVILSQVQDLKTVRRYKRAYFDHMTFRPSCSTACSNEGTEFIGRAVLCPPNSGGHRPPYKAAYERIDAI